MPQPWGKNNLLGFMCYSGPLDVRMGLWTTLHPHKVMTRRESLFCSFCRIHRFKHSVPCFPITRKTFRVFSACFLGVWASTCASPLKAQNSQEINDGELGRRGYAAAARQRLSGLCPPKAAEAGVPAGRLRVRGRTRARPRGPCLGIPYFQGLKIWQGHIIITWQNQKGTDRRMFCSLTSGVHSHLFPWGYLSHW